MFQFISTHFLIVFCRPDAYRLHSCNLHSKISTKEIIPSLLLATSFYTPACSLWCYYRPMFFLVRHRYNITRKSESVKRKLVHSLWIKSACIGAKNRLPILVTSARTFFLNVSPICWTIYSPILFPWLGHVIFPSIAFKNFVHFSFSFLIGWFFFLFFTH